jgi:hypothetical protein
MRLVFSCKTTIPSPYQLVVIKIAGGLYYGGRRRREGTRRESPSAL